MMLIHLTIIDYEARKIVEEGYSHRGTPKREWSEDQKRAYLTNQKCMNTILCGICNSEFHRIHLYKTTH